MTNQKAKHERYAINGGDASFHDVESGNVYGTAEGDRTEGSHAPDMRVTRGLGGKSLRSPAERLRDADADAFFRSKGIDPDKL